MWYSNKTVNKTYTSSANRTAWALINGVPDGWKQIHTLSDDGVSNVLMLLSQAKANNRSVDVFVNGNRIERVVLL